MSEHPCTGHMQTCNSGHGVNTSRTQARASYLDSGNVNGTVGNSDEVGHELLTARLVQGEVALMLPHHHHQHRSAPSKHSQQHRAFACYGNTDDLSHFTWEHARHEQPALMQGMYNHPRCMQGMYNQPSCTSCATSPNACRARTTSPNTWDDME